MKKPILLGGAALGLALAIVTIASVVTAAQESKTKSEFALQVTPATLIESVKPGEVEDLDLKILNNGKNAEQLKIELREFDLDKKTGEVNLTENEPPGVKDWITFSQPIFNIEPGESFTQKLHVEMPQESGFSYSFAMVISRTTKTPTVEQGTSLSGSVAVFALISVDKPGATRSFEVTRFKATSPVYEYMPATFETTYFNSGNTFVQPMGNIFIQRGSGDTKPIATLQANAKDGYLLPDRPRTLVTDWTGGFPEYRIITDNETGEQRRELVWDWSKLADFRIGPYTAKLVAVYNDGQRDIPVYAETTFWVFPWRIILTIIVALIIFVVGLRTIWRKTRSTAVKLRKRRKGKSEE